MSIILLFVFSYLVIYIVTNHYHKNSTIGENILISTLFFSTLIVLSTEVLSLFHGLTFVAVLSFWSIISCIGSVIIFKNKEAIFNTTRTNHYGILNYFQQLAIFYKIAFVCILALLSLILVQGIIYPPNNWDSMTYHLPRVFHWIQNQSVENYPTHILRQLYQPLFSEYAVLHTVLLTNTDLFANTVQFSFLLLTTLAVAAILKELNASQIIIFISIVLCLTLPEAILEASSTQNDITHSFFTIVTIYFAIKCYKTFLTKYFVLFGLAIGFSLLTKAIAYLYIPCIILVFGVFFLSKMIREKKYSIVQYSTLILVPMILLNMGHSYRNHLFSGHITGVSKESTKGIVFDKISPKIVLSSCIKNAVLHSDVHFDGGLGDKIAEKTHMLMNVDLNEPGSNIFDAKFKAESHWKNHEDSQPNFIHFILFLVCVFFMLFSLIKSKKMDWIVSSFFILISIQFVLFCGYLCWEPWNTRLHLPLFFEMIVFISLLLNQLNKRLLNFSMYLLFPILFYYGFYLSFHNFTRPYMTRKGVTSEIYRSDDRYKKYFANNPELYLEYTSANNLISRKNLMNIGLIADIDGWEYPLIMNRTKHPELKINHIKVSNSTKKYTSKNQKTDCIISTYKLKDTIEYQHSTYQLMTPNNKKLFIYLKKKNAL